MPSPTPPRLTGPAADSERARRTNDPLTERALSDLAEYRVYQVEVTNATAGTEVRHDLREAIIPLCQAVGTTARVTVLSVAAGVAVLRNVGSAVPCQAMVRFERVTRR